MSAISAVDFNNMPEIQPGDNVFDYMLSSFRGVVFDSLFSTFNLGGILADNLVHTSEVDTIKSVRTEGINNGKVIQEYINRGEYNSGEYHAHPDYISINRKVKENIEKGAQKDGYTGKSIKLNDKVDLDHIISAKEIHDDPARVLAGLKGADLANNIDNLTPTNSSVNRAKKAKTVDDFKQQLADSHDERVKRITDLKSKEKLTSQEEKELNKLENLESVDPNLLMAQDKQARKSYERKLNEYYKSPKFIKRALTAAGKEGFNWGIRQSLGAVFAQVWFSVEESFHSLKVGTSIRKIIKAIGKGIEEGIKNAKENKFFVNLFGDSFIRGVLESLKNTLLRALFDTTKKLYKVLRQMFSCIVRAGKVLFFNVYRQKLGDRVKTTLIILSGGVASVLGTCVAVGLGKTFIGAIPEIGDSIATFISLLLSGLLSCGLVYFLDRSKLVNKLFKWLNKLSDAIDNYQEISDRMSELAARLSRLDIEIFEKTADEYEIFAQGLNMCKDPTKAQSIIDDFMETMNIPDPTKGGTIFEDPNAILVIE